MTEKEKDNRPFRSVKLLGTTSLRIQSFRGFVYVSKYRLVEKEMALSNTSSKWQLYRHLISFHTKFGHTRNTARTKIASLFTVNY